MYYDPYPPKDVNICPEKNYCNNDPEFFEIGAPPPKFVELNREECYRLDLNI